MFLSAALFFTAVSLALTENFILVLPATILDDSLTAMADNNRILKSPTPNAPDVDSFDMFLLHLFTSLLQVFLINVGWPAAFCMAVLVDIVLMDLGLADVILAMSGSYGGGKTEGGKNGTEQHC